MPDFIVALLNPDVPFLRYGLFAGLLASVPFGIIGTYVTLKRISYLAGAIAHSVLFGIGGALFLQRRLGIEWMTPMGGALVSAIAAALIIGMIHLHSREREETIIGAIWVLGMSGGLLLLSVTPGYTDATTWLFGSIAILSSRELLLIAALDLPVIVVALLFHRHTAAIIFDEEFSRVRGIPVGRVYLLLLVLTAVTIVLMMSIVGIVMVIALITLPSAIAALLTRRLWGVIVVATLLTALFCAAGLWIGYGLNAPAGLPIVIVAGLTYLAALAIQSILRRLNR